MLIVFFVMMAIVGLLDPGYYDLPIWLDLVQFAACAYYILSPARLERLLFLLLVQISIAVYGMPAVSNHVTFQTIVNFYLAFEILWTWFKQRSVPNLEDSQLEARVSGNLRRFVLALYFFFTFHKLNRDFFDPNVSCAKVTLNVLIRKIFLPIGWIQNPYLIRFAIWSAIAIESVGPVLLSTRTLRKYGLSMLVLLHIVLMPFAVDINALMFGYLVLFLPRDVTVTVRDKILNWMSQLSIYQRGVGIAAFLLLCLNSKMYRRWDGLPAKLIVNDVLCVCLVALILPFVFTYLKEKTIAIREQKVPVLNIATPFLVVWIIIGLGPYLGFRNVSSGNMYSNLRTEGWSNHLLIPKGFMQVSDEIDRLVEFSVEDFDFLHYQMLSTGFRARPGHVLLLPEYELGRIAASIDPKDSEDRRNRVLSSIARFSDSRERFRSSSWLAKKVYWFRPLSDGENVQCTW